jgi:GMP synthase (glutamine-hydrolysing)
VICCDLPVVMTATVLVVQHEPDTGAGWFGGWLTGAGLTLETVHPYAGQELPPLSGYAGLLVLGGAMAPADDDDCPWLPATRALMAEAVRQGVPTFGICLGAELLALGLGGEVRRGTAGPELGVLSVDLGAEAADDPVFSALGALPAAPRVVQWHWEEIAVLPAGAVLLASSPAYPHQAFRVGPAAWGVQGHPEVTGDIAAAWAREDSPLLLAEGRLAADLVAEVRGAEAELAETWRPLAESFATVVRQFHDEGRTAAAR